MSERVRQRNLRNQIGETAAAAVSESQANVQRLGLQHRMLAAQMLEFERTVATVKAGRAFDRGVIDSHTAHITELLAGAVAHNNELVDIRAELYRRALKAEHDERRIASMTWWQRLRWNITGRLPALAELGVPTVDASTETAYPGDGV